MPSTNDVPSGDMDTDWFPSAWGHFSTNTGLESTSGYAPAISNITRTVARPEDWAYTSDDEIIPGSRTRTPDVTRLVEDDIPYRPTVPPQSESLFAKYRDSSQPRLTSPSDDNVFATPEVDFTTVNQPAPTDASQNHTKFEDSIKAQSNKKRHLRKIRRATDAPGRIPGRGPGRKSTEPDPITGRSKTKTAVDHAQRKEIEREYKRKVAAFIDDDIQHQVDLEGGITPDGRLFKAVTLMFERVKKEPQAASLVQVRTSSGDDDERVEKLELRNQCLVEKIRRARDVLVAE